VDAVRDFHDLHHLPDPRGLAVLAGVTRDA
jgi:hypothetical protein